VGLTFDVGYRSQLSGLFLGEQADEPGREQTVALLSKGARPPKQSPKRNTVSGPINLNCVD
jgi:hypothetical protein